MDKTQRTLTIIYAAFLAAGLVYLIVAFALSGMWTPVYQEGAAKILRIGFMAVSAIACVIAIRIKVVPKEQAGDQLDMQKALISRAILSYSIAEVPAVLGFLLFLLTGNRMDLLALWGLSFVTFLIVRPKPQRH